MPSGNSRRVRSRTCGAFSGRRRPVVRFSSSGASATPSIRSTGSMTLPSDFDIFSPSWSRTMPWMYTSRKGTRPVKWVVIMTMRATQKKMIS